MSMTPIDVREGYIPVTGGRVWYQIIGSGDAIPLLVLHGGPGVPHDYLEPLAGLADERPVVFYDQLGCGKSDRPEDVSLWHIERFVEELSLVRQALELEQVNLLGHSWGTMLATDYALSKPAGIASLIMASPALSVPKYNEEASRLVANLPPEVQMTLQRHEAAGTTDAQEYRQAAKEFNQRHLCRLQPRPEPLQRAGASTGVPVYRTMWGLNEFRGTGNLKHYDRTGRLQEITLPTLFTCGRYDECTPTGTAWYQSLLPGSEMVVFEQSSHMPHLEEPEQYLRVVRDFLRRVETMTEM
jgi:proline iminopeptidase